jgi:hypothetical protein
MGYVPFCKKNITTFHYVNCRALVFESLFSTIVPSSSLINNYLGNLLEPVSKCHPER